MIKASANRLIVRDIELEKAPESTKILILPKNKQNVMAEVIATGKEVDYNIGEGDMVLILHDTGIPVEIEGIQYLSITESQILAIIQE